MIAIGPHDPVLPRAIASIRTRQELRDRLRRRAVQRAAGPCMAMESATLVTRYRPTPALMDRPVN